MTSSHRLSSGLLGTGGVALADILANSVAVLLILIFLSVNAKQQQAEQQLEQTVDVSVLMARQLADSVVLDALPNSRPAYLHDYQSCLIPHDCNASLYPVVEIYDDKIRLQQPPITLTREQLFTESNSLDAYFRQLNRDQINNVRVDIYGIGMFYLAVATLREYGAPLNHWHFLGEGAGAARAKQLDEQGDKTHLQDLLAQGEKGLSEEQTGDGPGTGGQIPDGTELANAEQLANLESERLLPPQQIDAPSSGQGEATTSDDLAQQLLDEFARRRGENAQGQPLAQNRNQTFRLRIPNYVPSEDARPMQLDLDRDTLELVLLGFIFAALNDADNQLWFNEERLGALFAGIARSPQSFVAPVSPALIKDVQRILHSIPEVEDTPVQLGFGQTRRASNEPIDIQLPPNSAIDSLTLGNNQLIPFQREMLEGGAVRLDMLLRAYPFVYKGERVEVRPNMLVLSLPRNLRKADQQWRPVALVTPDLQEITLGFVNAGYAAGKLGLPLEVNQVRANSQLLQTSFTSSPGRQLWQLVVVSGAVLLLLAVLLLVLVRWYRKNAATLGFSSL